MLCKICTCMLRGGTGQQWNGTHDLTFKHHTKTDTLRRSREAGCSICIALANELRQEIDLFEDHDLSIEASLSEVKDTESDKNLYRLDFVLQKRRTRTFVLRHTDPEVVWLRTPKSFNTSSDEVFELAQSWISKCQCADFWKVEGKRFYPKRLLDIDDLKRANGLEEIDSLTFFSKHANLERAKVRLIETDPDKTHERKNNRYVTLSHCWGKPRSVQGQLKLTSRTEDRFKRDGIELKELSKTFRDAMLFACRLDKVGYIWIDSLCIKQPAEPGMDQGDSERDWLDQSRVMDQIYRGSYLNISATAAFDGDQGLFFKRRPEDLWEDEINLNLTGLSSQDQEKGAQLRQGLSGPEVLPSTVQNASGSNSPHSPTPRKSARISKRISDDVSSDGPRKLRRMGTESIFDTPRPERRTGADYLRRCTIIDVSFWNDLVEEAPVNRRGWVLQERVMAPRVLHFCRNQIAWECSEFQDAEGHPEGLPPLKMKLGDIVDEGRLKSLRPEDGFRLRQIRLKGFFDPDINLKNLHIYELWKRMVEVYSRTKLTVSGDKLIALSGIARRFSELLGPQSEYVAGMWAEHLESQLLWHVNEDFKDGIFKNGARRDPTRAPSFSWASVDTPHGILYGETTDYGRDRAEDLLFHVKAHQIFWQDPENKFGLIDNGKVILRVRYLRKIELKKLQPPHRVPYSWRLADGNSRHQRDLTEHFNLYLDAPETDVEIFQPDAKLYCMAAAFGERTVKKSSRYLICLLLKLEGSSRGRKQFKRIGLTKLSNYADQAGQKALREKESVEDIAII
ncbi:HET-domain-containing protein [Zopfia rhizophila CBS 207.26]|uniref:HET-domain-containing protein n=1 Tax=Zopfia rhizophila CBS 207.26 TaxID=1314779 RepID=A0A6A6EVG1_9PEZI|nr:HET-domain-containing protein [Zopfia rhizophila CBS 207.26]